MSFRVSGKNLDVGVALRERVIERIGVRCTGTPERQRNCPRPQERDTSPGAHRADYEKLSGSWEWDLGLSTGPAAELAPRPGGGAH